MTEALLEASLKLWPFDNRPPLDKGVEDGIVWATVKSPGAGVNGYVLIPAEGHPWSRGWPREGDEGYSQGLDDLIDVHGGVTYACHPWLGFDTAHAWDVWPGEYDKYGITRILEDKTDFPNIHWTPALVAEEAKRLARQVAEIGRLEKQIEINEEAIRDS